MTGQKEIMEIMQICMNMIDGTIDRKDEGKGKEQLASLVSKLFAQNKTIILLGSSFGELMTWLRNTGNVTGIFGSKVICGNITYQLCTSAEDLTGLHADGICLISPVPTKIYNLAMECLKPPPK